MMLGPPTDGPTTAYTSGMLNGRVTEWRMFDPQARGERPVLVLMTQCSRGSPGVR
jgi:hypothetical protein